MKRLWMGMVLASVFVVSGVAFAQEGGGVVYERETSYDFDDDVVEGTLVRPDGEFVSGNRGGKQSKLISIRQDFIPEMVRSVEEL